MPPHTFYLFRVGFRFVDRPQKQVSTDIITAVVVVAVHFPLEEKRSLLELRDRKTQGSKETNRKRSTSLLQKTKTVSKFLP